MPPLPAPLASALSADIARLPKRERTRRQLITAAIQVLSARGVAGASIQEIAAVAGMANSTVYNHFDTKDEVVQAVAIWLADTLCRRISDSYAHIKDGAERMSIGGRRYIWLAEQSPMWALLMLEVAAAAPDLIKEIRKYSLADLRLGIRQKSFRVTSIEAAMDLINGTGAQAMRSVAYGLVPSGHDSAVAAMILRGLGMPYEEADAVARRPLPDFPAAEQAIAPMKKIRRPGRAT